MALKVIELRASCLQLYIIVLATHGPATDCPGVARSRNTYHIYNQLYDAARLFIRGGAIYDIFSRRWVAFIAIRMACECPRAPYSPESIIRWLCLNF